MPKLTFEKAVGSISKEHKIDIESVSNMNVLYPNQNQLTKQKPHQRGINTQSRSKPVHPDPDNSIVLSYKQNHISLSLLANTKKYI